MNKIEDDPPETNAQKRKRILRIINGILQEHTQGVDRLTIDDILENFWRDLNGDYDGFLALTERDQTRDILNRLEQLDSNDDEDFKQQLGEILRAGTPQQTRRLIDAMYPNFIKFLYSKGFKSIRQMLEEFNENNAKLRAYYGEFKEEHTGKRKRDTEIKERQAKEQAEEVSKVTRAFPTQRQEIEQNLLEIFHTIESDAFFHWLLYTQGMNINIFATSTPGQLFQAYQNFSLDTGRQLPPRRFRGGKITPTVDNPALYEKAKAIADQKYSKPSAYKSGFIVKEYKRLGGTYSGAKTKTLTKQIKKIQGGAIPKAIQTRARTALRKSGQDYSEEDVERKEQELHQKYLANKEKASKRAEKRETKQLAKDHMITIAVLPEGSPEVDLPRFYAVEKTKNIKYKKKNGEQVTKQEKQYKLVNPLTKQRNIAQRQGSKPVNLKRKDVDKVTVENTIVKTIPLDRFVSADQKKAFIYNKKRTQLDEDGVAPKDRPDKSNFTVKERGRPELLPKNIYHHQNRGTSKLNEKLGKLRNPREPEETKEETYQQEEKDGYEPPAREPSPKRRGRPRKYGSADEAKKAKMAMTVESNRRRYQEKKEQLEKQKEKIQQLKISEKEKTKRIQALDEQAERLAYAVTHPKQLPANPNPRGEGIMDVLNSGFNYVVDKGKEAVGAVVDKGNQVGNFFSKIVTGSTDFSPSVHKILDAEGDNLIKSIVVGRTPVNSAITMALNAVSQGQFQKNQDSLNYDKLFHLFSEITLADGKQVRVEKNEVITMTMGFKQDPDTERQDVAITKAISFRDLVNNARRKMKQKFFAYDSANNNCQDFIMALIQASGLGSQENFDFIKQNTKQLFEKIPRTRALAKQITNLGQRINIAKSGGKISSNNIMPKFAKGSQEARDHMARIRGMRGGKVGSNLAKNLAGNTGRLADAGTNKLINMMGTGTGKDLGKNLALNTGRLADAGTNKLISMMGTGVKEDLAKLGNSMMPVLDFMKPTYLDQLGGLPEAMGVIGGGHHIHHHHYHPNSYGGNVGYGAGHSAEYGHHSGGNISFSNAGPQGRGFAEDLIGKLGIKMPTNVTEAVQQAQILQGLTPQGIAISQVKKMMGRGGPKGLASFNKWTKAIGDFLAPVAKPILEAGTKQAVNNINAYGDAYANRAY